jgi:hypothetical protein
MAHDLIGRFGELGRYFRQIGVCIECAKNFAAAAVRKETGRRVWSTEKPCVALDTAPKSCRDIGHDGWDARPGAHLQRNAA